MMRRSNEQLDALYAKREIAFEQKNWIEQQRLQALIDAEKVARWNEHVARMKPDNAGAEPREASASGNLLYGFSQ